MYLHVFRKDISKMYIRFIGMLHILLQFGLNKTRAQWKI